MSRPRPAFTLLEVILALAILVGALAVVSKLVELSARSALYARYHARAIELAESKMQEVVAGLVPLDLTGAQSFDEDPDFQWELQVADGPITGLKLVRIYVTPSGGGRLAGFREPVSFELVRYVLDRDYLLSVLDATTNGTTESNATTDAATEPAR